MRDATNASYYHLDKAYVNIISLPLWGGIGLYNHNIRSRDFRDSHATHPFLSFFHLPFPLPPFYPNSSEQTVLPLPVRSLQRAIVPMDDVQSETPRRIGIVPSYVRFTRLSFHSIVNLALSNALSIIPIASSLRPSEQSYRKDGWTVSLTDSGRRRFTAGACHRPSPRHYVRRR